MLLIFIMLTPLAADIDSTLRQRDSSGLAMSDSAAVVAQILNEDESEFIYPMSPERKEKLISYSRFVNIWRFVRFFVGIAFLLILLLSGLSARFRQWAASISKRKFIIYFIYILLFTLFLYVVNLPFDYYRGFLVEHEYGFSNQTAGEWFGETLKALLIEFIFSLIIISIMYWLINKTKKWWLYLSIGSIPFLVFVILIYPVLITPMFNKFIPVQDKTLASEMTDLAEKAGIHNPDIFEVDASKQSSKLNAYFVGLLGTKRIVLYDTIIKNFSIDEMKYVMAHEIGHYIMNHIWYGLIVAAVMIFIACWLAAKWLQRIINRFSKTFGFDKLGNIASLPLIILFVSVFSFVTQPITNAISRRMEYQADRFGMELSAVTPETAATVYDKLSVYNLSDPDPSPVIEFWFYDHPALNKRIERVKEVYKELHTELDDSR